MPPQKQPVEEQIGLLAKEIKDLKKNPPLATHSHTGFDVDKVRFTDLLFRTEHHYYTLAGTLPATAANYGVFFIASANCYVNAFKEVHKVAGSDAGAVTLQLEKLTSGVAPDSGTALLATALSLKATADVVQTGSLTTTTTSLFLATGDRLCLKDAGTPTAVANVTVLLEVIFT